ncbi:GNAT family N-acetyltransferase [Streptomyces sp. NPDC020141]|uniref:GNAT family N-acetyltransferase n=1 Tax=Streptomyces sp. NPDC020141 TaxID=3365065 RepID=UPI00379E54D5
MRIRPAAAPDADFLGRVLLEAYNWDGTPRFTLEGLLADPASAHYVAGWPRSGDFGVVAEDASGTPVGAAWARIFPEGDQGYGFVAADVPELTLGVLPEHRGRGVGRALMAELVAAAAAREGVDRISLSVEDGNRAVRLYESCGFRTVGRNGGSDTMVLSVG